MQIDYDQKKNFLGRNGTCNCNGLNIQIFNDYTLITPITSKGLQGRCWIEIPTNSINKFCTGLQHNAVNKIFERTDHKILPTFIGIDPICDELLQIYMKKG